MQPQHGGAMHDPMGRPYPGGGPGFRGTTNMHNMSGGGLVASSPMPTHLAHNSSLNAMNSMAASMSSGMPSGAPPPPPHHHPPQPQPNQDNSKDMPCTTTTTTTSTTSCSSSCSSPPPCSSSDANDAKLAESVATVSSHSGVSSSPAPSFLFLSALSCL